MWSCARLSNMWEVGPGFICVSPFIIGSAVLCHMEFCTSMAILGWRCVWAVWSDLPMQLFLVVGGSSIGW